METLVNDGWVKNTILRLHTQGFSVLHIYKAIQGLGGKFGKHFFKMGPPNTLHIHIFRELSATLSYLHQTKDYQIQLRIGSSSGTKRTNK